MIAVTIMFLSIILLRLTLDSRVRRYALPADWEYTAFPDFYLKGITRTIIFGLCCVFPHINNADMYRCMYNDIDIKAFANSFEKFLGWAMSISVFILCMCCIIFFFTDWLNIVEWN